MSSKDDFAGIGCVFTILILVVALLSAGTLIEEGNGKYEDFKRARVTSKMRSQIVSTFDGVYTGVVIDPKEQRYPVTIEVSNGDISGSISFSGSSKISGKIVSTFEPGYRYYPNSMASMEMFIDIGNTRLIFVERELSAFRMFENSTSTYDAYFVVDGGEAESPIPLWPGGYLVFELKRAS